MSWFKGCLVGNLVACLLLALGNVAEAHPHHTAATPATSSLLHYLHPHHAALPLLGACLLFWCLNKYSQSRVAKLARARVRRRVA
jgi:hypothetical protein